MATFPELKVSNYSSFRMSSHLFIDSGNQVKFKLGKKQNTLEDERIQMVVDALT